MLESISGLFEDKKEALIKGGVVSEREARFWVENWLRGKCGSEALYCEQVQEGAVLVRVDTGWLRAEISLWQADLLSVLRDDLGIECSRIQFVY